MKVKKVRVNMSLHPVIHAAFAAWCLARGKSVSSQVEALMASVLAPDAMRTKRGRCGD